MATTTRTKRPEIVLATWPQKERGAAYFGDRRFTHLSSCDSMWLSLRVVDDDSYAAYRARSVVSNIGLWVWWSTDSDSISVEFKAHDVFSASVSELKPLVAELVRLNKRVPQRVHGQSYTDYVVATLRAAGIKRAVQYRGIGSPDEHTSLASAIPLLREEIDGRSKRFAVAV